MHTGHTYELNGWCVLLAWWGGLLVLRGSVRRGASSGGANQLASQSAAITKQQQLPMVQQNQDPFCYSTFWIQEYILINLYRVAE